MRKETVEQRAVKIAAKIMVAAGLCGMNPHEMRKGLCM